MAAVDESARLASEEPDDELGVLGPRRRAARPRRFRPQALLLATFGWIVQVLAAALVAQRADVAPIVLGGSGALLLALAVTWDGEVPFAAIGVAAVGTVSAGVAAFVAIASTNVPIGALTPYCALVVATVIGIVSSIAAFSYALSARLLRALAALGLVGVLAVGGLALPRADRGALFLHETVHAQPGATGASQMPPRGLLGARLSQRSGVHHSMEDVEAGAEPSASVSEPTRVYASVIPRISLRFASLWLVGLALAVSGALAVRRALARLVRLDDALVATRAGDGFVLEDGRNVLLDREPEDDVVLVTTDRAAASYRSDARARGVVVGTGSLEALRVALRRRIASVTMVASLTVAAAWLPLLVLRLDGWAIAPFW